MTNVNEETTPEELQDNTVDDEFGNDEADSGEEAEVEVGGDLPPEDGSGDSEGEGDDHEEGRQASRDRAKAQINRLKEENKRLKEENRKAAKEGKLNTTSADVMAKAYLAATHDIKEADAQEEALRLADKFEMSVDELMDDPDYQERIKSIQKRVISQRKLASSRTGSAAQKRQSVDYIVDYFRKNQSFPEGTSLELRGKAVDQMTKRKNVWD